MDANNAQGVQVNNTGVVDAIGAKNATVLMEQDISTSRAGFMLYVSGGHVGKIGGPDVNRVEIIGHFMPLYLSDAGVIDEIGDNTLIVGKAEFSQAAIWNVGTIGTITGGDYHGTPNTHNDIFVKGASATNSHGTTLSHVVEGKHMSADTRDVTSLSNGQTYACYYLKGEEDYVAKIQETGAGYDTLQAALDAAGRAAQSAGESAMCVGRERPPTSSPTTAR